MVQRNPHIASLKNSYLFVEVAQRKKAFCEKHPDTPLIDLGIGDFADPVPHEISDAMSQAALSMGTKEGFSGYGPAAGSFKLRRRIADVFYPNTIEADEIHISDGAKPDMGRMQLLFGKEVKIAVQEPVYPVYLDTSFLMGQKEPILMPCLPDQDFFPDLLGAQSADIIFFCSPNNPTGTAATKEQLEELVNFAQKNRCLVVFDAAYSAYIRDPNLPKSIYEIEGAKEVAIEVGSFSKMAGFTGIRLGWSVVPKELKWADGKSVAADWQALNARFFNGASVIAQAGGIAALTLQGLSACRALTNRYLDQAQKLKTSLEERGFSSYGGQNSPYVWTEFKDLSSWEAFDEMLHQYQIITVPGSGFGKSGEGFLRFSGFSKNIEKAIEHIKKNLICK